MKLTAVTKKRGEIYVTECVELGVACCGATPEESFKNLQDAVRFYLENAARWAKEDQTQN
ncbi:MAG: hypothetical protein DRN91_01995 [Candidatus Alkanophagales archaeon]|nr:MAG: hypothetical protein DRN91_01995 [Candidatus Alkanophagales archaeon]